MAGRIYLLNDCEELVAMEEAEYDSESLLQRLLADHNDLLAGEQIDSAEPRRWLLVTREMSVRGGDDDSPTRWSLDHLFLDQDAIPTLIEVKRSSDSRTRRTVVGQMLDYAANAIVHWPVEEIRARFERRCELNDEDPEEVLNAFLGDDQDADEYWQRVKTNLQAGRIRMIFLADVIPTELRRVVEFLNEQMDPAEVLAIEIRQFVGEGMRTLVPRVLGQTEAARRKKSTALTAEKLWNEESFMAALEDRKGPEQRAVAEELLHWIEPQVSYVWWGRGSKHGGIVPVIQTGDTKYQLCRMGTQGAFVFRFDWIFRKPPFDDEAVRRALLARINEIPGVHFGEDAINRRARIPFQTLTSDGCVEKLKSALSFFIDQTRPAPPS